MIDWSSTALVFPGQGSQQVGMGADLVQQYPAARQVFEEADHILGFALSNICFEGPAESLDETSNTQPALYVIGVAVLRVLEAQFGALTPIAAAGHSLGEFTALTAAGALPFSQGVALVRERGRLMKEAGEQSKGAMAALLGPDLTDVQIICEQASTQIGQPVVVANDNCPGQIVISGDEAAVECALTLAKAHGAKRAVRLAVSVAAHSPLMAHAAQAFHHVLIRTTFETPRFPVIGNVNATPLRSSEDIYTELNAQLTSSVQWTRSVQALLGLGTKTFIELGAKDVLTGLLRRIDRSANGVAVNNPETVAGLLAL
ncbi:MAG: ACP S-malonyltransferase [Chloroflexota bacterium]